MGYDLLPEVEESLCVIRTSQKRGPLVPGDTWGIRGRVGPPARAKQAFPGPVLLQAEALSISWHLRNLADLTVRERSNPGKQRLRTGLDP